MGLKLVLDTLDGLDESTTKLYAKGADGKFRLDVDGVEDTSGLKSALQKERKRADDLEKVAKKFEGLDPDEVRVLLSRLGDDEDAKLIKEGKFEELIGRKTEKMRKDFEKKLEAAKKEVDSAAAKAGRWSQRVLDNALREAAVKAGLHAHAIDDALFRGRAMFSLDEDGNAVQLDRDGQVVMGKNGKTPFTPTEWLDSMRDAAPHWFPANGSGSGAPQQSQRGGSKGNTMKRADFDALPPQEKIKRSQEGVVLQD